MVSCCCGDKGASVIFIEKSVQLFQLDSQITPSVDQLNNFELSSLEDQYILKLTEGSPFDNNPPAAFL